MGKQIPLTQNSQTVQNVRNKRKKVVQCSLRSFFTFNSPESSRYLPDIAVIKNNSHKIYEPSGKSDACHDIKEDSCTPEIKVDELKECNLPTDPSCIEYSKFNTSCYQDNWKGDNGFTNSTRGEEKSFENLEPVISGEKEKVKIAALEWQKIQDLMNRSVPVCKGHGEPCVARVMKKEGPNIGRGFYVCTRAKGPASNPEACCSHFEWSSSKGKDTGRGHQNQDKPPIHGAISGPQLGAAAHRLVVNSLQLKSSSSGRTNHIVQQPVKNQNMSPKPRPAGPQGYEKGFHLSGGQVSNGGMDKSQQNARSAALVDDHISTKSTPNRKAKNKVGRGRRDHSQQQRNDEMHGIDRQQQRNGVMHGSDQQQQRNGVIHANSYQQQPDIHYQSHQANTGRQYYELPFVHGNAQRHPPRMRPPSLGITTGSSLVQPYSISQSATINGYPINPRYATVNGYPLNSGVYDHNQGRARSAMLPGNMYYIRY